MAINAGNGVMLYTTKDVCRMLDIPPTTLNYWTHERIIEPSIDSPRGKGLIRLYSFTDLVAVKAVNMLRKRGVSLQAIRQVVDYLRRRDDIKNPLSQIRLMIVGDDVIEYSEEQAMSLLRDRGQQVMRDFVVLDIGGVVDEIKEQSHSQAA